MPKRTFYSKLLLAAILLSFIAIAANELLPKRRLIIAPAGSDVLNDDHYFLLPFKENADNKKVYWVDKNKLHFHCVFTAEDKYLPCNFLFMPTVDPVHGIDLSVYNHFKLGIKYQGKANVVRLAIRNFDPRFSVKGNDNSSKFNYINLRTKDLKPELDIKMSELVVAEWWVSQFNLSRDLIHPDFRNATVFSIDIPDDTSNSEHDIEITRLEFIGDWITPEQWYLGILLSWLVVGAFLTTARLLYLQKLERAQAEKISDLVVTNTQLRRETDKFRKLSTVDALTNAFNRHGIEQIIESLEFRLDNTALIMIDIDYFKRINDRRGHDAGDRVLQKISEIILTRTRTSDKFGRWGGEEFILICPNTSVGMATALAEKIRLIIFDTVFEPENPLAVTASFGVAAIHRNEPFSEALARADRALYEAKDLGRNCVIVSAVDNCIP